MVRNGILESKTLMSFVFLYSTVSSGLNAIVAVILVDIYKPLKKLIAERRHKQFVENDAHNTLIAKVLSKEFEFFFVLLACTFDLLIIQEP